jgi:hypothetical protein
MTRMMGGPCEPVDEGGHMKFKKLAASAVIAQVIAMLGLSEAYADVVLTYTGNDFTFFQPPYNGTDRITATITLADPLGNSTNLTAVTPISYSISDGVQTFTACLSG